jgi:hypothetical protein
MASLVICAVAGAVSSKAPKGRQMLAHGVSHGKTDAPHDSPGGAEGTPFMSPLTGLFFRCTASAVGCPVTALLTFGVPGRLKAQAPA